MIESILPWKFCDKCGCILRGEPFGVCTTCFEEVKQELAGTIAVYSEEQTRLFESDEEIPEDEEPIDDYTDDSDNR